MKDIYYSIKFYAYWHVGGKDGANPAISNAVLKDTHEMPYIGGKTLKGLIRDGAEFLKNQDYPGIDNQFITDIFGTEDQAYQADTAGKILNKFHSAHPDVTIPPELTPYLYHQKARTALNGEKQARPHSLRTAEATIPMKLIARIENFTGSEDLLKACLRAVKRLGENRHRGFGRCEFEVESVNEDRDV